MNVISPSDDEPFKNSSFTSVSFSDIFTHTNSNSWWVPSENSTINNLNIIDINTFSENFTYPPSFSCNESLQITYKTTFQ